MDVLWLEASQEVETAQFFDFFQAELGRQAGYQGIYRPKSRAKTMSEDDARTVDGCAIFYRPTKYVPLSGKADKGWRTTLYRVGMHYR